MRVVGPINPRFTCFAYALRIERLPQYNELVNRFAHGALASSRFIVGMIERGHIRAAPTTALSAGRVVIYYNGERLTHAARIVSDDVLASKWSGNEVYQHALWEVPSSYGDHYQVVEVPPPDQTATLLAAWVEENPPGN